MSSPKSGDTSPKTAGGSPISSDVKQTSNPSEATTSENESASSILYEKIGKSESRQIVQIETVEVSYEPVRVSVATKSVSECVRILHRS